MRSAGSDSLIFPDHSYSELTLIWRRHAVVFDKRGPTHPSKSAEKINYCFTQNLRLVLAPTSCRLNFSIGTHPRLELANDRKPVLKITACCQHEACLRVPHPGAAGLG